MSDEDLDPTEGHAPGHHDLSPDRCVIAYVRHEGSPSGWAHEDTWTPMKVKDVCLETIVVIGEHPPKWEVQEHRCPGNCHIETWLFDDANNVGYLIAAIPNLEALAQDTGMMIVGGQPELDPEYVRSFVTKRKAALN